MSLARTILRLAAVNAITGNTIAGDAVFDSDIDPIDTRVKGADDPAPLIVIYTDDDQSEPTGLGDFLHGNDQVELVIEIVYAGRAKIMIDPDGEGPQEAEVLQLSGRDATNEILLDMIERQAIRSLTSGLTPWSEIFQRVACKCTRRLSRRGASTEQGVRFAIRQVVLTFDPILDPVPGQAIPSGSIWNRAFALMDETTFGPISRLLRDDIEGKPITEWRRFAAQLGVGLETMKGIGMGPVGADDPVPLVEGSVTEVSGHDP